MPKLLRKIKRNLWFKESKPDWLQEGELHSDPLADMNTKDNTISVWRIESKEDIEPVIAALATTSHKPSNIGYVLFDESILDNLNISKETVSAETVYQEINSKHVDIAHLSASKLVSLSIFKKQFKPKKSTETNLENTSEKNCQN